MSHAQPQPVGIGWVNPYLQLPCTGLAHGNAGIALSLLRLAAVSGEDRFHQAARAALTSARSCYSPTQRNWHDLTEGRAGFRDSQASGRTGCGSGSPGVMARAGLEVSRLAVRGYVEDELLQEEIEVALQTTLEQGFGGPTDLCCGDVGNLETLLVASQSGQRSQLQEHVQHLAGLLLDRLEPSQPPDRPGWERASGTA